MQRFDVGRRRLARCPPLRRERPGRCVGSLWRGRGIIALADGGGGCFVFVFKLCQFGQKLGFFLGRQTGPVRFGLRRGPGLGAAGGHDIIDLVDPREIGDIFIGNIVVGRRGVGVGRVGNRRLRDVSGRISAVIVAVTRPVVLRLQWLIFLCLRLIRARDFGLFGMQMPRGDGLFEDVAPHFDGAGPDRADRGRGVLRARGLVVLGCVRIRVGCGRAGRILPECVLARDGLAGCVWLS